MLSVTSKFIMLIVIMLCVTGKLLKLCADCQYEECQNAECR
jgi:hypothetical protein